MKQIFNHIKHAARWLMKPIEQELNFFLVMWLINASVAIGYLVGCFFMEENSMAHAMRCLALGTFVAYLLTVLLHCCKKKWLRKSFKAITYVVIFTLQAVYTFIQLNFEMSLGPKVLILLAETNGKESSEFISTYAFTAKSLWCYGIMLALIAWAVVMEWKRRGFNLITKFKATKWVLALLFIPLILSGAYLSHNYVKLALCKHSKELNQWVQSFGIDALDHLSVSFYSMCYLNVSDADIAQAIQVAKQVKQTAPTITEPDSLNVVFVLGESYIKSHSALYGYSLNTTPCLIKERDRGNLIVFTDMITPYNATSQVQKNVFALNDKSNGEMWYEKPMVPTVLKQAGYKVFFWDNQRNYSKNELFTITVNSFIYNPSIAALSYDEISNRSISIDGNLIHDFKNKSKVPRGKYNFYIFHLMGQHVHPIGRYPKKSGYDVFTPDSVPFNGPYLNKDKRTYIAQYDNATLYNDNVMKRIFDLWRDKNTVVIYFSDHGDEAYDYRDHVGRGNVTTASPELFHCDNDVPFMIWCSDKFIATHPALVNDLRNAASRPGMINDASYLMLRLAGVNTQYYVPQRDISSPSYKPTKRIVYDKFDYDKVINKKNK